MLKLNLWSFGYLMRRTDSLEKTLMLGKIEGGRRRGWQRMGWLDGITDSMDICFHFLALMSNAAINNCCFLVSMSNSATPWTATCQAFLSFTISQSLLKFMSTELVKLSNHLILCCTLLLLLSIFPSIRVFSNESALCIMWPKCWSFSFSISPSNEYSGLISFRIDWFDLAVQGTLKSLLQHHNLKALVLWHSPFFIVQLSHLYMTTEKIMALTTKWCLWLLTYCLGLS